ncbi:Monopolin complex subunit Csm1/Pcs1 [Penicillium concentricum]|uniref:Monopolin complex subunit Csm1/Pcs1 n=1 Tax=Penicillium concentricum TaxID=293559 RepID=A0A9W9VBS8_9EURO|nr:Monopolin complex subunit Csm1/Pcs1 [Penicillium concentricum]KAJ5373750.1 Monopolin complex subunit Csm1/Pcs1 [Penicillium concentricum]
MPKRKAPPKISGLLGSDDEDIMQVEATEEQETHEPPAKRQRGRPRTSNENVIETKPTKPATRTRKQQAAAAAAEPEPPADKKPARRGRPRGSSRAAQDAETSIQATKVEAMMPEQDDADNQENEDPRVSRNTKKQPPETTKAAPARGRGRPRAVSTQLQTDGEFQFTPSGSRHVSFQETHIEQADPSPLARAASQGRNEPEVEDSQQTEQPAELVDGAIIHEEPAYNPKSMSPAKNARSRLSMLRNSQDSSPRKRKLGGTDSEQGDPELRRRLGELTKKYDSLESKYRNLREIGIVEANTNMEKLRKQSEAVTTASNELVASLKSEIDAQRKLGLQSRGLQKQLKERDDELARLTSSGNEARAQLASAQSEVKALQTKLAAARNTAASLEGAAKVPGSAIKGGAANRANALATAEAAQASQLAQLKEDLYSDLTGLIVRDVKNRESDYLYDCIQTGINGTLHFHLVVPKVSADYDKTEFQYLPHLDPNRDRDLVNLLPDFLTVDITFVRGQAAKFYTRVIDALTKRRSLPAQ